LATKKHSMPASRRPVAPVKRDRTKLALGGAGIVVFAVVSLMAIVAIATGALGSTSTPTNAGAGTTGETAMHVTEGNYTNVTAAHLADMLTGKDFTFVNVKTPYIGEIDGTDLYIPYDQITARAGELPATKSTKVLVYCRSGAESLEAVKSLLKLGYTNVWNLDGGMNAWTASGRTLIQKAR
jgi:rhodanese-related sulfurtransferase